MEAPSGGGCDLVCRYLPSVQRRESHATGGAGLSLITFSSGSSQLSFFRHVLLGGEFSGKRKKKNNMKHTVNSWYFIFGKKKA